MSELTSTVVAELLDRIDVLGNQVKFNTSQAQEAVDDAARYRTRAKEAAVLQAQYGDVLALVQANEKTEDDQAKLRRLVARHL